MGSNVKLAVAAAALSGAAWWFGTGLAPLGWLAWLAPLPVLLAAPRLRAHAAFLAALVAGTCTGLNLWHYLQDVIRLPLFVAVQVAAVSGLTFALAVMLHRGLLLRRRPLAATLAYPALMVAAEYLGSLLSPHGTFGSLAYSQLDLLPVIQLASATGNWGVSFVVSLLPAAAASLLASADMPWRRRTVAGAGSLAAIAGVLAFGVARLQDAPGETVRIGLVSLQGPVRPAQASEEGMAMLRRYLAAIDVLAARGARIVVLPETALALDGATSGDLAGRAARHNMTVIAGIALRDADGKQRNAALAFHPGAAQPAAYAKHHLIPGFEDQYKAGSDYTMLPGAATGLAVCKDMDFHDTARAYAARGAKLLLVPAWDFGLDGWLHSRMAVLRGVEGGFAIARVARHGSLTLSDSRGRIVAEATDEKGDALLVGDLPLYQSRTLYGRWGDWFAWSDLVLLLWLLPLLFAQRRHAFPART